MSRSKTGAAAFLIDGDRAAQTIVVSGRNRWALEALIAAGERGCTPITTPGPRWSGYVHNLRKMGVNIKTYDEPHGGPYAGTHARYVLFSEVTRIDQMEGAA